MLCEGCDKKEATFHLTEIKDDIKFEFHLCENCARELRLNCRKENSQLFINNMLNLLDMAVNNASEGNSCAVCGLTEYEYMENGKLGCPGCYTYLKSFKKITEESCAHHMNESKKPVNYINIRSKIISPGDASCNSAEMDEDINKLKVELENAVEEERYEDAARLRDIIREVRVE